AEGIPGPSDARDVSLRRLRLALPPLPPVSRRARLRGLPPRRTPRATSPAWFGATMTQFPPGYRVGHATDAVRRTGCTVILVPAGTVASVDVRGGAPGTRETGVFAPGNLTSDIHSVVLAGGSVFGLAASHGVAEWIVEHGGGMRIGPAPRPRVAGAVLFDLGVGDPTAFPDAAMGRAACDAASDAPIVCGRVGAGTGATVGKLLGVEHAS